MVILAVVHNMFLIFDSRITLILLVLNRARTVQISMRIVDGNDT